MYKMPICFNKVTYEIRYYGKRKGEKVLIDKPHKKTTREVCIGDTLELLNDSRYNVNLMTRLKSNNQKTQGCEIKIISLEKIAQCGYTQPRFKHEE